MRRLVLVLIALCVAVLALAVCTRGVTEFLLYSQALEAQYEQGQLVLDRLARAERIVVRRRLPSRSPDSDFDPDSAAYYLDVGDPPLTGSIRASLRSLKQYSDALAGLANGEAAEALSARLAAVSTNLVQAAGALQVAAGAGLPGAGGFAQSATGAITQALPIVRQVGAIAGRDAFRKQLIQAYPAMRQLVLALRDGTPVMYEVMRRSYVRRGSLDTASGIPASALESLKADRDLLAGWVLLMDESIKAMDTAVRAAMSKASPTDLATLTAASVELRALSEQIRDIRKRP